jgi:hypothetical protein
MPQYRVVRETTDNQQGAYVTAATPQEALYSVRGLAQIEKWHGTATVWHVYLDTKQWQPVYSEREKNRLTDPVIENSL